MDYLVEGDAAAADFREDGVGGGGPDKGFARAGGWSSTELTKAGFTTPASTRKTRTRKSASGNATSNGAAQPEATMALPNRCKDNNPRPSCAPRYLMRSAGCFWKARLQQRLAGQHSRNPAPSEAY